MSGDWEELWILNLVRMPVILNAAKYQGYSFYRFWVIKEKTTGGRVKLPPHTQIRVKNYKSSKKMIESFFNIDNFKSRKKVMETFFQY